MDAPISTPDGKAPGELIKSSGMSAFMADVIEESKVQPVLVDFWADWCEPCKTLTPLLEKVVTDARGAVKLVKVNADENKDLAAQLRIQSLPTVMAFKDGQPVDSFTGALPESEIKAFIAKLGGSAHAPDIEEFLAKAKELLEAGEVAPALDLYTQITAAEPENLDAIGGLARAHIKAGQIEQAREILKTITEDNKSHPGLAPAFAALELAGSEPGGDDLIKLKKKAEADPADNQAACDLAQGLFAAGQRDDAAETLLGVIRRERDWNEGAARALLLKMFEAAGQGDPFTVETRKKLSAILFS